MIASLEFAISSSNVKDDEALYSARSSLAVPSFIFSGTSLRFAMLLLLRRYVLYSFKCFARSSSISFSNCWLFIISKLHRHLYYILLLHALLLAAVQRSNRLMRPSPTAQCPNMNNSVEGQHAYAYLAPIINCRLSAINS